MIIIIFHIIYLSKLFEYKYKSIFGYEYNEYTFMNKEFIEEIIRIMSIKQVFPRYTRSFYSILFYNNLETDFFDINQNFVKNYPK